VLGVRVWTKAHSASRAENIPLRARKKWSGSEIDPVVLLDATRMMALSVELRLE
jgi:hypothetical protein